MVWLSRAATSPQHNGSHVNRQRSRGMLDSVTSRPEFCYSALSSAETACLMLCLLKLRLSLPQPEAPQDGKKTHLSHPGFQPPHVPILAHTDSDTDKSSSALLLCRHSCHSSSVNLTASCRCHLRMSCKFI